MEALVTGDDAVIEALGMDEPLEWMSVLVHMRRPNLKVSMVLFMLLRGDRFSFSLLIFSVLSTILSDDVGMAVFSLSEDDVGGSDAGVFFSLSASDFWTESINIRPASITVTLISPFFMAFARLMTSIMSSCHHISELNHVSLDDHLQLRRGLDMLWGLSRVIAFVGRRDIPTQATRKTFVKGEAGDEVVVAAGDAPRNEGQGDLLGLLSPSSMLDCYGMDS
jgi:hypothetical protein